MEFKRHELINTTAKHIAFCLRDVRRVAKDYISPFFAEWLNHKANALDNQEKWNGTNYTLKEFAADWKAIYEDTRLTKDDLNWLVLIGKYVMDAYYDFYPL